MTTTQKKDPLAQFSSLSQKSVNPFLIGKHLFDDDEKLGTGSSAQRRGSTSLRRNSSQTGGKLQVSEQLLSKLTPSQGSHRSQALKRGSAPSLLTRNQDSGTAPKSIPDTHLRRHSTTHNLKRPSQNNRGDVSTRKKKETLFPDWDNEDSHGNAKKQPEVESALPEDDDDDYEDQNGVNDRVLNTIKNENFDLYSRGCLEKLRQQREDTLKKSRNKHNQIFIRNQNVKKQLDDLRAMKHREELSDFGKYLAEPNAPSYNLSNQVKIAEEVLEHQHLISDFSNQQRNRAKNQRALKATLLQSRHATEEYERKFGEIQIKNKPLQEKNVRAETEKLLERTKALLAEMDSDSDNDK